MAETGNPLTFAYGLLRNRVLRAESDAVLGRTGFVFVVVSPRDRIAIPTTLRDLVLHVGIKDVRIQPYVAARTTPTLRAMRFTVATESHMTFHHSEELRRRRAAAVEANDPRVFGFDEAVFDAREIAAMRFVATRLFLDVPSDPARMRVEKPADEPKIVVACVLERGDVSGRDLVNLHAALKSKLEGAYLGSTIRNAAAEETNPLADFDRLVLEVALRASRKRPHAETEEEETEKEKKVE